LIARVTKSGCQGHKIGWQGNWIWLQWYLCSWHYIYSHLGTFLEVSTEGYTVRNKKGQDHALVHTCFLRNLSTDQMPEVTVDEWNNPKYSVDKTILPNGFCYFAKSPARYEVSYQTCADIVETAPQWWFPFAHCS